MNELKVQGTGLSLTFLGVTWAGKTQRIPTAITDDLEGHDVADRHSRSYFSGLKEGSGTGASP